MILARSVTHVLMVQILGAMQMTSPRYAHCEVYLVDQTVTETQRTGYFDLMPISQTVANDYLVYLLFDYYSYHYNYCSNCCFDYSWEYCTTIALANAVVCCCCF